MKGHPLCLAKAVQIVEPLRDWFSYSLGLRVCFGDSVNQRERQLWVKAITPNHRSATFSQHDFLISLIRAA
jgi:hypothetical protein